MYNENENKAVANNESEPQAAARMAKEVAMRIDRRRSELYAQRERIGQELEELDLIGTAPINQFLGPQVAPIPTRPGGGR